MKISHVWCPWIQVISQKIGIVMGCSWWFLYQIIAQIWVELASIKWKDFLKQIEWLNKFSNDVKNVQTMYLFDLNVLSDIGESSDRLEELGPWQNPPSSFGVPWWMMINQSFHILTVRVWCSIETISKALASVQVLLTGLACLTGWGVLRQLRCLLRDNVT